MVATCLADVRELRSAELRKVERDVQGHFTAEALVAVKDSDKMQIQRACLIKTSRALRGRNGSGTTHRRRHPLGAFRPFLLNRPRQTTPLNLKRPKLRR